LASEIIRLERVNAYYADSHVLQDVSFALREATVLALLGRNGAGKTTCLHSINGLVPRRTGAVFLSGRRVEHLPPEEISRQGLGFVPQGRHVFPSLTVRENLLVAARAAVGPGSGNAWTLDSVYALFPGLRGREGQLGGSLSGGEQQMLVIGRALMTNPRVLLLDEPSEGLAPQIVNELRGTLDRLKAEGLSILLVEQNLKLAFALAEHCVILNTGQVVYDGPVADAAADQALLAKHLGVESRHG
jgi:branched-chain amino acid transport system ATP-binding protein